LSSNIKGASLALTNRLVDNLRTASLAAINATNRTSTPVQALVFTNFSVIGKSEKVVEKPVGELFALTGSGVATFGLISALQNLQSEAVAAGPVSYNNRVPFVTPDGVTNFAQSVNVSARLQTAPVAQD
jgi:hypothetical protein